MPELPEAIEDDALSVSLFEIEDERTADRSAGGSISCFASRRTAEAGRAAAPALAEPACHA